MAGAERYQAAASAPGRHHPDLHCGRRAALALPAPVIGAAVLGAVVLGVDAHL